MDYSPKEKRVLKKLGIKDFRYMTKDKIVQFASMLPKMSPEVAKTALKQFPDFVVLAKSMANEMRLMTDKSHDLAKESQDQFYDACNHSLAILNAELSREDLTQEERDKIIEQTVDILTKLQNHDNKVLELKKRAQDGFVLVASLAILAGAAILGAVATAIIAGDDNDNSSTTSQLPDLSSEPSDEENIIEADFEDVEDSLNTL